jgi:predicted RNA-binding protein with PUA-like domain
LNYWIFKANPEQYRIDDRMLNPEPMITWAVTRYHERIQKGDTVFIWRAGTPRGICAIMTIEACPYEPAQNDLNDGFELPPGSVTRGLEHWAKARISQRFPIIEANIIKKIPGLELFSFFSAFQQAINFTITRPEGTILMEYIEQHQANERKNVLKPAATKPRKSPHAADPKKSKPATGRTTGSSDVTLLKCEACGRFVVSSDTDRHARESHPGESVTWKKTK